VTPKNERVCFVACAGWHVEDIRNVYGRRRTSDMAILVRGSLSAGTGRTGSGMALERGLAGKTASLALCIKALGEALID